MKNYMVLKSKSMTEYTAHKGRTMDNEIWKPIVGYEEYYEVSNLGRVKRVKGGDGTRLEKILKGARYATGYIMVGLCANSKQKNCSIHRLVAMAFLPNPENKPCVNHINGVKTDNRVENLEWSTYQENNQHAWRTGLIDKKKHAEALKGMQFSEEHKRNLSESQKGKHYSEETRMRLSEALKGRVWVNDGTRNYLVRPEQVQEYMNKGYAQGLKRRI